MCLTDVRPVVKEAFRSVLIPHCEKYSITSKSSPKHVTYLKVLKYTHENVFKILKAKAFIGGNPQND